MVWVLTLSFRLSLVICPGLKKNRKPRLGQTELRLFSG